MDYWKRPFPIFCLNEWSLHWFISFWGHCTGSYISIVADVWNFSLFLSSSINFQGTSLPTPALSLVTPISHNISKWVEPCGTIHLFLSNWNTMKLKRWQSACTYLTFICSHGKGQVEFPPPSSLEYSRGIDGTPAQKNEITRDLSRWDDEAMVNFRNTLTPLNNDRTGVVWKRSESKFCYVRT